MPKLAVLDMNGEQVGDIELAEQVFGITPNKAVLHDAVIMQRASQRQGTHDVKGRSEVRGGGRKPWRQKGTGRARHGSIRSPIWVGGGVAFGPTPRSYAYKLPKKVRRLALKSALSSRVLDNSMVVLDKFELESPKTQLMAKLLQKLQADRKTLFVTSELNDTATRSARNIPTVKVITASNVNVLDVLNCDKLICTREAVNSIEGVLSK